jgi:hypothetical protein
MVIALLRHIEHNPLIYPLGAVLGGHFREFFELTAIVFDPDQLIILTWRCLPVKIS